MANFIKLENDFLPKDGDWYKVDGIITEEDIQKLNALPRKTILVIDNTKGLSSEVVGKISSSSISFSVVGGLDYFNLAINSSVNYLLPGLIPRGSAS